MIKGFCQSRKETRIKKMDKIRSIPHTKGNQLQEWLIDFIRPISDLPPDVDQWNKLRNMFLDQLIEIPNKDILPIKDELKKGLRKKFFKSLLQPGELIGQVAAQSISQNLIQGSLDSFHKVGQANRLLDKGSDRFSDLINVSKGKGACEIFFSEDLKPDEIKEQEITEIFLDDVCCKESKTPPSYFPFDLFWSLWPTIETPPEPESFKWFDINLDVVFNNRIDLEDVKAMVEEAQQGTVCVFTPDFAHFGISGEFNLGMKIQGIQNVGEAFVVKNPENGWGMVTKGGSFQMILSSDNDLIDKTKTISNDIWEIYETLGVIALERFLLNEFQEICGGSVDRLFLVLLVKKIVRAGSPDGINRYALRKSKGLVFQRASFEEPFLQYTTAAFNEEVDNVDDAMAACFTGSKGPFGATAKNFDLIMNLGLENDSETTKLDETSLDDQIGYGDEDEEDVLGVDDFDFD